MKLSIVEILGYYKQPTGPQTDGPKVPFYDIRQNDNYAFNSHWELGLQILIDYLGDLMWINIQENWLCH
jgi:hypothetical protein